MSSLVKYNAVTLLTAAKWSAWSSGVYYYADQIVRRGYNLYFCITGHTAGTFSTDWLTNGYWACITESPGTIKMDGSATADPGWLACNGSAVSRSTYADLFAKIGTTFGDGEHNSDGSSSIYHGLGTGFNLPDNRGISIFGSGTTDRVAGVDGSGAAYTKTHGAYTTDKFEDHYHSSLISTFIGNQTGSPTGGGPYSVGTQTALTTGGAETNGTLTLRKGNLTEPASLAVAFYIRY